MKIVFAVVLITASVLLGALQARDEGAVLPTQSAAHESPFACDRLALSPEARARHFDQLGPALRRLVAGVRELPDGFAFQLPTDFQTASIVAEWIAGERLCCPFFDIDFRVDREGGPAWLMLTGRPGTKDFIKSDLASWIRR